MTLRDIFIKSAAYSYENNIFFQRDFERFQRFETVYLSLREKEHRIYSDEIVKMLPFVSLNHPLGNEWKMRKLTSQRLVSYLRNKTQSRILELGCGNGWLSNYLAQITSSEVVGMDVNEKELRQGARVFAKTENLIFLCADIFDASLPGRMFDYIILSASIQYFKDPVVLVRRLLSMLAGGGEIHIVDSPFYNESEAAAAHNRSEKYFSEIGFPSMTQHYYHHTWKSLASLHPVILYDPDLFFNRIKQKYAMASPFPWIRIGQKENY